MDRRSSARRDGELPASLRILDELHQDKVVTACDAVLVEASVGGCRFVMKAIPPDIQEALLRGSFAIEATVNALVVRGKARWMREENAGLVVGIMYLKQDGNQVALVDLLHAPSNKPKQGYLGFGLASIALFGAWLVWRSLTMNEPSPVTAPTSVTTKVAMTVPSPVHVQESMHDKPLAVAPPPLTSMVRESPPAAGGTLEAAPLISVIEGGTGLSIMVQHKKIEQEWVNLYVTDSHGRAVDACSGRFEANADAVITVECRYENGWVRPYAVRVE